MCENTAETYGQNNKKINFDAFRPHKSEIKWTETMREENEEECLACIEDCRDKLVLGIEEIFFF